MSDRSDTVITSLIEPWMKDRRPIINAAIEKYFPRKVDAARLETILGPPIWCYDVDSANYSIYEPGWELLDRGGKRWRPLLMMLVMEALGKDPREFADFLVIPEVVHNGTLIIDDIEDGSELRRNAPCIHRIKDQNGNLKYGVDLAINCGNTMYYEPLLAALRARGRIPTDTLIDIYEIYAQEMININHGQGTDLYWHHGKAKHITVDQYLQMCAYKTGTLARMSTRIGARLAGADRQTTEILGRFAESIAVAFQIQDDVLNLKEGAGKEFAEDIKEGKRSLLVIRALSQLSPDQAHRLEEILDLHTGDRKLAEEAIAIVTATDAFEFCRLKGLEIIEESWKEVEGRLSVFVPFGGFEKDARSGLRALADFLVKRSN